MPVFEIDFKEVKLLRRIYGKMHTDSTFRPSEIERRMIDKYAPVDVSGWLVDQVDKGKDLADRLKHQLNVLMQTNAMLNGRIIDLECLLSGAKKCVTHENGEMDMIIDTPSKSCQSGDKVTE